MKFWTIWHVPAMSTTERLRRTRDWGAAKLATKLPVRLRYFTVIQEITRATSKLPHDTEIPGIPLSDILANLDAPKNLS